MSTLITHIKRLALALCLATPIVSWAATPVAVWDGDFSTMTKGTYTLSENGNTKTDSYLEISGDNGILLTSTDALNVFTVIARCEGLNLNAENGQVLFTSYGAANSPNDNKTGVYLPANNAPCRGIWEGADWNDGATQGSVPANYTTLIYNHQQSNGTYAYALCPTSDVDDTVVRTTLYSVVGLRSSGTTYKGFAIGGLRGTTSEAFLSATGLKITSLAVFSGTLTEAEMKGYLFPSEVPVFNVTVSEDKSWSEVLSAAGVTDAENSKLVITAENNPKITFDAVDSVLYELTVNGSAVFSAGDTVYGSGVQSFGKTLLSTTMGLSLPNVSFGVKEGWKGAFVKSANAVELYAQNAETISINIGGGNGTADTSDGANLVSGSEYYGLYPTPGSAWNNISGRWQSSKTVTLTSAKAFDGETTTTRNTIQLSGTSGNTWQWTGTSVPFLRGYLDDTAGIQVQIVGVPYSEYDVIIYATSDSNLALNYFTINGTDYTCGSDGIATEGTSSWGVGQTTTPTLGKNAMLVQGVTGSTLTISGTRAASDPRVRVTVCAVQIINKGVVESSDWSANLDATTSFSGGTGSGLSGQSGTWVNSALASITVTNKASDATLTLDGEITAGALKIVGDEGKKLTLDKASGASLDITAYNLTESAEEVTFLFNPDFSKVDAGSNLVGVGYDYTGTIGSGFHYKGSENVLTLGEVNGGSVNIGGEGTIAGDLGISGDATVTFSGNYTSSGNAMLGATKGVLNIAEGASVSVPHVRLVNSGSSVACTMNVNGALTVTSESTGSNVYSERENYKGILFGHYYGSSTVNVGSTGSITGTDAWMQLTYTAPNVMTIDGGAVKVRGINGGTYGSAGSSLTLTGGGVIEVAEGFVNMSRITRDYGYGTIKTYSYDNSTGWTDPGAITFTDATNGTTIDPCGMDDVFSGALSGAGKIVVSDSVGGGSVSFSGDLSNFTGDIVVGANTTLNLGTTRPAGTVTVDGILSLALSSKADVPVVNVSAEPTGTIKLYDTDGTTELEANVTYDPAAGTVTVKPPVNTWDVSADLSFDTAANWSRGLPVDGQDLVINVSGDAVLTVSDTYSVSSLTISGNGVVEFAGEGSITADAVYLANGAVLERNDKTATSAFGLGVGSVLRLTDTTETAIISGAGAVETYGDVDMAALNTFTGGITAKTGTLTTSVAQSDSEGGLWCTGFGEYMQSWACTDQRCITVEDGACVDINNVINGGSKGGIAYRLVIAGKGVLENGVYSGAVKYSALAGQARGLNARQISYIELTDDAMVDVSTGWGLLHHYYGEARLVLNGHILTFRGASTVPLCNVKTDQATSGTVVLDGASLAVGPSGSTASNLAGVNIIAKRSSEINFIKAPSALGSLTIKPSATGTTASAWNLPQGLVPVVDATNIDYSEFTDEQVLTLFTAPNETVLSASTINAKINGRYTTTISGNTIKATYHAGTPANFLHYNFDNGAAVDTGAASDSGTTISSVGEAGSVTLEDSYNGKAVQVHTGYTPYWDTYANGVSPFHAGEVTVTTVAKIDETNIILWGLGGAAANLAMGLVVTDANTAKVVARKGSSDVVTLATATVEQDLTSGWHFFAVVSDESGTKLYVDDSTPVSTNTGIPAGVGQAGQLGSFHGGAFGGNKVSANGYYLDDWRVYDAALTADEVTAIRAELTTSKITIPDLEEAHLTVVSVKVGDDVIAADSEGKYSVPNGSTVVITFAPGEGGYIDGDNTVTLVNVVADTTVETDALPTAKPYVAYLNDEEDDTKGYRTLADAVAAASTGDKVIVTENITLDARVEPNLGSGTTLTIDLGNKIITRTGTSGNGSVFDVKSGTVTITNGTINCTQDDTAIAKDGVYAITSRSGSTVVLETLTVTVNSECGACAYPFTGSTMTIKSGTYSNTTETPYRYKTEWTGMAVNQANVDTQLLFIEGGTFSKVNPALGDDNKGGTFLASGYESTETSTGVWTVTAIPTYNVTLNDSDEHIQLSVSQASPVARGATVLITVAVDDGYMVDEVEYVGITEEDVVVNENAGTITFTMPNNAVTVTVTSKVAAYTVTSETELGEGGTLDIGSATKIKIGTYDVTAGFSIDGTTATLLAPEVEEEATKKAIDVGATTVTLNVDLVPGLFYGVAASDGLTLNRPDTLTQYTGSNAAAILTVTKPSDEKGFFKVFVDIKGTETSVVE